MWDLLGEAGQRLRDDLAQPGDDEATTALIVEAARHKDRLDRLHLLLSGDVDTWATLAPSRGDPEVLELKIDAAAAEARQLATVFRQTLGEIARRREGDERSDGPDDLAGLRLA